MNDSAVISIGSIASVVVVVLVADEVVVDDFLPWGAGDGKVESLPDGPGRHVFSASRDYTHGAT